ncbi:uncharacterized protein LOC131465769 [Solea solea]|uniref:uncharacterized protein LOC131465769 n=1 Tax=Solea solea TaxID=90069 RepID=UPI00272A90D8|nr:uncharacterized protein LOC131465769 [Solea solea]
MSKEKYSKDEKHRDTLKALSKQKYSKDEEHRKTVKALSKQKYSKDEEHRKTVKALSKQKYSKDEEHRKTVKALSKQKYSKYEEHRKTVKALSKQKYSKDEAHRKTVKALSKQKYSKDEEHRHNTSNVLPRSTMEGSLLPVKLKRKLTYKGHYRYQYVDTMHIREALRYLKQANVHYKDIEFNEEWLNELGRQPDVEDVEVGSDARGGCSEEMADVEDQILHDGQQDCMLQDTCSMAVDVEEESLDQYFDDMLSQEKRQERLCDTVESGDATLEGEDELLHDRQQHCMFQDTCLLPVDVGQEALDQYFDDILNLAPGEGNSPVKMLSDLANEAKCFPVLFPLGHNTYHESRPYRLTMSRYLNNRILHADSRFAQNVEYIFFGQYMSEIQQVVSSVSIALRKGKGDGTTQKVSNRLLKDDESLKKLLQYDEGYRFLKPIRGTPSFWQGVQRDLIACVRQLGIPTWFCSFSSADLRWTNLLHSILKQEGRTQTVESLEWADRCDLLRRNPVTAARMFDFRWHVFLNEVLKSPLHPIGKIIDYFYRVEFQQRGSPHVHCLFWIENAPKIDENTDEEVVQFIDKYVTCELPSQDEGLLDIVTSVQQHSKRHSKTCRKNKTVCRFNFPRPASSQTFVCRTTEDEASKNMCQCKNVDVNTNQVICTCGKQGQDKPEKMDKELASNILKAIKSALSNEDLTFDTTENLFQSLGINQALFEAAYKRCARKTHVVLKRQPNEVWINQYSKPLLKCWNANLDIQYVVDAYACIVYIISYISKAEREMGLLLANAQKEASKGNVSAKQALKNLGSVYLHNRDVCAQEAVYRLTNMHLRENSRNVVFVPTGENVVKMSLPINVLREKATANELTTSDMWMTSLVERYKNRPNDSTFNNMCIATFASEYRILTKNQKSKNPIKLNNNCGFVTKRTRTQPAVVRYMRVSETKNSELFHMSILQLFLPYRVDEQLKPPNFESFELFYGDGHVRLSDGSLQSVKSVVDQNRGRFEKIDSAILTNIQESVDLSDEFEDAWAQLCPEQEIERADSNQERTESRQVVEENETENIPDLAVTSEQVAHLEKKSNIMCRSDGLALIRSLNETQLSIFYEIRQWCLAKINGQNPDPFHVFITGGAGTGKSHLIKAIQYEATRLLSPVCRLPDNICVLLTAPTGIAAYNLHASTIHSTFSIGKDVRLPYIPLGEEKLNSLRAKYVDLQILIIDEISMVDHNLLAYIHGRLRQIKQTGDYSPFGKVSVIAVGDFFQLPPVRGKPLYIDNGPINLWSSFSVVELTEIVRQKDGVFAQLLNRVRTRSKGTPMLQSDVDILKNCETGEVSPALHIFPTNMQVNGHNTLQLRETCLDYVEINAKDYVNSKKTGNLELKGRHHANTSHTCLAEKLLLGRDARVMLIKNIDVMDGLVNGVCGTVTDIIRSETSDFPLKIYVKFDDEHVGAQRRKESPNVPIDLIGSTAIEPEEERATKNGGMRRQFPLKLAWAVTVHKVQGITVDEAVVCLERVFSAGQAYVALSRVRNLSGLIIQDFKEKAIYCKDDIKDAIQNMPKFPIENVFTEHRLSTQTFTVFLMNVQNLTLHLADLATCTQHLQLNCIAVTETWLPASPPAQTLNIDGYTFHSCPRSSSYSSNNLALIALQGQQHGGVGMYTSNSVAYERLQMPDVNLECLIFKFISYEILVAVIYRPPSYPMSLFKEHLGKLIDWLDPQCETITIMGDFNDDILKSSSICKFVTDRGFVQDVSEPTTERGTLIDHVYLKSSQYVVGSVVCPTYFSDHEGILCTLTVVDDDDEEDEEL